MSMKKETRADAALHKASIQGDVRAVRFILDTGRVHVDCKDKDGSTPLILAANGGHLEVVEELLDQGANPGEKRLTGTTALFFAAQGGYLDVVSLLLDRGAEVDSTSADGSTPLFVACQSGYLDIVQQLIRRGASVNAYMKDRTTPLFMAAQNGHVCVLNALLAAGAVPDATRSDGATPLWIAAQMGHERAVRALLRAGAFVDAQRHDGATPLFKASHKGHVMVVQELLKFRPCLGILPNGESALHAAALFGHLNVARELIAAGADTTLRNEDACTPAELAASRRYYAIADLLDKASAGRPVSGSQHFHSENGTS